MPTLFKRSNGIFDIVTDGKNGRRRWISTGERTRSRAAKRLETYEDKPQKAQQSKRLSAFINEFLSRVSSFYSKGTLGIYRYALRSFLSTIGGVHSQRFPHNTSICSGSAGLMKSPL